jgi:hypothetical protein
LKRTDGSWILPYGRYSFGPLKGRINFSFILCSYNCRLVDGVGFQLFTVSTP